MLTAGTTAPHRIERIATGVVLPLLTAGPFAEALAVDEEEACRMSLPLARQEGIITDTSGALNIVAAFTWPAKSGRDTPS
ncbi:hypothetical protein [Streptomyces sp. NBC_01643]|uniref:hypothetical protein n=1 Tax=Streptomyces sp. NBC_01643 TaxID=2975906 RepID=UPI002F912EC4|nr:hypothetical protein OHB03_48900 [Streptomyces sp. NBC_01643]